MVMSLGVLLLGVGFGLGVLGVGLGCGVGDDLVCGASSKTKSVLLFADAGVAGFELGSDSVFGCGAGAGGVSVFWMGCGFGGGGVGVSDFLGIGLVCAVGGTSSCPVHSLITAISRGSSTRGEVLNRAMAVSMVSIWSISVDNCVGLSREACIFSLRKFKKSCPKDRKSPPRWVMSFSTSKAVSGFLFWRES